MKKLLFYVSLVLLGACTTNISQQASDGPGGVLLSQANQQAEQGEVKQAIAILERAVRIEPRNGHAWLRLGELHLQAGDPHKAEQFGRRALQFSAHDRQLSQAANRLIEQAQAQQSQSG